MREGDDYLEYHLSREFFRDRLVLLCLVFGAVLVVQWFGVQPPDLGAFSESPRGFGALVLTAVIAAMWLVFAVVGAIGLVRWFRR